MENIINELYEEIKRKCYEPSNYYGSGAWDYHIKLVYEIAVNNCGLYGANKDIVALASLLHDVASITDKKFKKEHHIIGAEMAEEILEKYNLEKADVELIKRCIMNHRGSVLMKKTSPEEVCIADSDAIAHFYSVYSLFKTAYCDNGLSIDEGRDYVYNKLQRSYNKISEIGRSIVKPYYEAVEVLFGKK